MPLRGVLLDVDGTLVLSVDAHARAWVDALREAGHEVPLERVRPLIGMGGDRIIPMLLPGMTEDDPGAHGILERRKEIFLELHAPSLAPAPGARALLERMRADGLQLIVASSAQADELAELLERARVTDLVGERATSDDAETSKPAPDIVQAALERAGLGAQETVMLGDTPYDIEAAGAAGVGVLALRCGGFPDETFRGALAVYDDPAHLLREYDASALARSGATA